MPSTDTSIVCLGIFRTSLALAHYLGKCLEHLDSHMNLIKHNNYLSNVQVTQFYTSLRVCLGRREMEGEERRVEGKIYGMY
jgi:hypothetical protein